MQKARFVILTFIIDTLDCQPLKFRELTNKNHTNNH
jgi:hypothetical protein